MTYLTRPGVITSFMVAGLYGQKTCWEDRA